MAAPGRGGAKGRRDTEESGGTAGKHRGTVGEKQQRHRSCGCCGARAAPVTDRARSGVAFPSRPVPSRPLRAPSPPQRSLPPGAAGGRHGGARGAVLGLVPPPGWGQLRLAPAGGGHAGEPRRAPGPRSGRVGTALGAQFVCVCVWGSRCFLQRFPGGKKHSLVRLKEQPPFVAVRRSRPSARLASPPGRPGGRRCAPVPPEGPPRRWNRLDRAFACLYL